MHRVNTHFPSHKKYTRGHIIVNEAKDLKQLKEKDREEGRSDIKSDMKLDTVVVMFTFPCSKVKCDRGCLMLLSSGLTQNWGLGQQTVEYKIDIFFG